MDKANVPQTVDAYIAAAPDARCSRFCARCAR